MTNTEMSMVSEAGSRLQQACHSASYKAGWWHVLGFDVREFVRASHAESKLDRYFAGALVAQKICLSHSELSEAMEGHRKGLKDDKLPHRSMLEVELADAIIRILDIAESENLDVIGAIIEKVAYNRKRADHQPGARAEAHGKKF